MTRCALALPSASSLLLHRSSASTPIPTHGGCFVMPRALGRLHVITDEVLQTRFTHAEIAALVTKGGADAVQYREKRPKLTRELIEVARGVVDACVANGATSIIDDRVDVAEAVGATDCISARTTCRSPLRERWRRACSLAVPPTASRRRAGCGSSPSTTSASGRSMGRSRRRIRRRSWGWRRCTPSPRECPVPVIAIGSITAGRVPEVLDAGAYGVAVISAITCAADPEAAAREFMGVIEKWLAARAEPAR